MYLYIVLLVLYYKDEKNILILISHRVESESIMVKKKKKNHRVFVFVVVERRSRQRECEILLKDIDLSGTNPCAPVALYVYLLFSSFSTYSRAIQP